MGFLKRRRAKESGTTFRDSVLAAGCATVHGRYFHILLREPQRSAWRTGRIPAGRAAA